MEQNEKNSIENKDNFINFQINKDNITVIDFSYKNLHDLDENIRLPENLNKLILAHNGLTKIPVTILNLPKLKILDVSFNNIEYFDDTPNFFETMESLNISNNKLMGPPYWIWAKNCKHLVEINLSSNVDITNSFINGYFEELLQYSTPVKNIIIHNCRLKNHLKLLNTFPKAKLLNAGTSDLSHLSNSNRIEELPREGLDQLCDIEKLVLSNTNIYNVNKNINIYKNLKEIDLSLNQLGSLPNEFCNLENLEICILSFNNLLYLPDGIQKLAKLECLLLNSNRLCLLPENLNELANLRQLDLYDNCLYEGPDNINLFEEIDLAQNYFKEPENEEYYLKKDKIRLKNPERYDGSKIEVEKPESEYSSDDFEDEELMSFKREEENRSLSSLEDWDSDDYWVPHIINQTTSPQSPWMYFVKQKMEAGNFCPIDAHIVPISDQVKYEKMCNPKTVYESDGQFDDFSGDDS